mmetsp:Transcript_87369/g.199527  ORF Transcript_87369/g.199527 Transcript_87369/m.199527 type:complete len:190 (-) Transcript_87369:1353-1922(-)
MYPSCSRCLPLPRCLFVSFFGLCWCARSQRDNDGFTPFVICAQFDNTPLMEWMYLKGNSTEDQDNLGRTALQWACYKGHCKTAQWLLSRGANIRHRDFEGMTALHWSALKGHEAIANMLLDVGAVELLCTPDSTGDTPIRLANKKGHRYLEMCFQKARLCQLTLGRPFVSHNALANCFAMSGGRCDLNV